MLFFSGFTISVITKGPSFNLFEWHSRDHRRISVPDGTLVSLRFKDFLETEKYIAYLEYRDLQHSFFQLQFIKPNIDHWLKCQVNSMYDTNRRSARKRKTYGDSYETEEHENIKKRKWIHEREKSASIFGSPKHDKIKQRKREHISKFKKNNFTYRVTKFKSQIGQGPCYICVVCNRWWYWRSVIGFCANNCNVSSVTFSSVKSLYDFK